MQVATIRFHCDALPAGAGVGDGAAGEGNGVALDVDVPRSTLEQNYPNPFNPNTTIRFQLQRDGEVRLQIFTPQGQLVKTIAYGHRRKGAHKIAWDGTDTAGRAVAAGAYFYRIELDGVQETRKMIILK